MKPLVPVSAPPPSPPQRPRRLGLAAAKSKLAEVAVYPDGGAGFLARVESLRRRHGGGVDDFEPAPLSFTPDAPFARRQRRPA